MGPELAVRVALNEKTPQALPVLIADPVLLTDRYKHSGHAISIREFHPGISPEQIEKNEIVVWPVSMSSPAIPGHLNPANAGYVLECLTIGAKQCLTGTMSALVTGPIHKGVINEAGIPFTGHTEFLAELCKVDLPVMMLTTAHMRVALVTTHLPLSAVSQAISSDRLKSVIQILDQDLRKRFALQAPRILVCGLNPHAGENGHLGREELDVITPVLETLREKHYQLIGPVSADTAFTPNQLKQADVVLAMYHDQGLPVLKYSGFGQAINITLGLPIIRTSVDHGTALTLAGTGKASSSSLSVAFHAAIELADNESAFRASN